MANPAGLFTAIAAGFGGGLSTYFNIYFWELDARELALLQPAGIVAAFFRMLVGPWWMRKVGKRAAAMVMFVGLAAASALPVVLRLLGLLPSNDSPFILWLVLAATAVTGALTLMTTIAITSMIADIAEDSEVKTGRRSEGLLVSVDNILKKTVAGVGAFSASMIITVAALPETARPGMVPQESLAIMGWIYAPALVVIYLRALLSVLAFQLDETAHEANLAVLRARATDAAKG